MAGLAPGDYKVEFYFDETLSSRWAHRARDEESFTVLAGEETVVDEQRYPTGATSLTAFDTATGESVTTFCVEAIGYRYLRTGCTDTGTLLLNDLPEGWYLLTADPDDGRSLLWDEGTVVADQVTPITIGYF